MRNFKLTLAYDGTEYCGWQAQGTGCSIQERLELAWLRVTQERVRVIGSGRTDAGVHALGQVVSVRSDTHLPPATLVRALNARLPEDIRVMDADLVPWEFHAIRSARGKLYRYWIQDGGIPDPFIRRQCWFVPRPLRLDAMCEAAESLRGEHDFAAFQTSGSPRKDTVRHVRTLTVQRTSSDLADRICLEIAANGFLYNMVRNIVGTLVQVGQDKRTADSLRDLLRSRDRRLAGPTAPAKGLCLVHVEYDDHPT